jgi:hypothetical protein
LKCHQIILPFFSTTPMVSAGVLCHDQSAAALINNQAKRARNCSYDLTEQSEIALSLIGGRNG